MIEKFIFPGRAKSIFIACSLVGLVLVLIGAFTGHDPEGTRFWTNFLLTNFYFTAISVLSVAWIAINHQAKAGWSAAFKRIPEAVGTYLPVGLIGMLIMLLFSFVNFGGHANGFKAIYEWMNADEVAKDEVLKGKSGFLNIGFFSVRIVAYFALWIFFARFFRRNSIKEDAEGGLKYYNRTTYHSATFLPIFGLTFCLAAFDWLMSTEPHWYSTIYGVNVFASALVGFLSMTIIIMTLLRRAGYMQFINDSHYHDIGKMMFGFSIFWTYTWVAQFLLIWYANLPEETPYYLRRMHEGWWYLFFGSWAINFLLPLLGLMTRNAKRRTNYMFVVAILLLIGRYTDWYLATMPGTAGAQKVAGFGALEIGFFLFFGGIFGFVVGTSLTKANLVPVNHPFLGESLHHDI